MSANGIVTTAGRILKARMLRGETPGGLTWFAFGSGDWSDKANPPGEDAAATTLAVETCRKLATRSSFLELDDENGDIPFEGHLYAETETPTGVVAFIGELSETEALGFEICEQGLFGGSIVVTASPFALPTQVTSPGILYWLRNRPQLIKAERETYRVIAIFRE